MGRSERTLVSPEGARKYFNRLILFPTSVIILYFFIFSIINAFINRNVGCLRNWIGIIISSLMVILLLCLYKIASGFMDKANFKISFDLWLQKIIRPLILGAIFGVLLSLIYFISLFLRFEADEIEYDTIIANFFAIYITCTGLFIAFWGLYHEKIPIMDLTYLMESLKQDMDRCKFKFAWAFPGLDFGSLSAGGQISKEFRNSLENLIAIRGRGIETTLFILNAEEILNFYQSYKLDDTNTKQKYTNKQIGEAVFTSIHMINKARSNSCNIHWVKPEFKYELIIIDDIIYFINTFGLPIKVLNEENEIEFIAPKNNENNNNIINVDVIATKIQNATIAGYLLEEMELAAESAIYKSQESPNFEDMDNLNEKTKDSFKYEIEIKYRNNGR